MLLKKQGLLPQDWELTKCLFGENQLLRFPDKKVILVESEKTALIGTAFLPQYLWLATGGKLVNLGPDQIACLKDRDVTAFPDLDAINDFKSFPNTLIQQIAPVEGLPDNADLADCLVQRFGQGQVSPSNSLDSSDSPDSNEPREPIEPWQALLQRPEIQALVEELGLEVVGVSKCSGLPKSDNLNVREK